MSELDALTARLTALETVTLQLMTHLAVRDDDPPAWVATRKTLALNALETHPPVEAARLRDAVTALFDQLETATARYAPDPPGGTAPSTQR
jgi:hypothetical protein